MIFKVLTLFPEMINSVMETGIIGRAIKNEKISVQTVNIRDFADNNRAQVDDYPYGGGAGQVIQAQPVYDAFRSVVPDSDDGVKRRVIYLSPQGRKFDQRMAKEFADDEELVFLCGHYEGVDERVLDEIVTDFVSAGDYILTGGELPALMVMDAVSRLLPGVLGNDSSPDIETFYRDLLEYPQYTRPEVWHDKEVPPVLLTGNHKDIEDWRLEKSVERTRKNRSDLFRIYTEKTALINKMKKAKIQNIPASEALSFDDTDIIFSGNSYYLLYDNDVKSFFAGCFEKKNLLIDGYESRVINNEIKKHAKPGDKVVQLNLPDIITDKDYKDGYLLVFTERTPLSTQRVKEYGEFGEYLKENVAKALLLGKTYYVFVEAKDKEHVKMAKAMGFYMSYIKIKVFRK